MNEWMNEWVDFLFDCEGMDKAFYVFWKVVLIVYAVYVASK
jgi:hypothetical protein